MLFRCSSTAFLAACALTAQSARAADWSGEAGFVTDYRYRGISLSRGGPAFQASIAADSESGPYFEIWASTLGSKSLRIEGDLNAGYAIDIGNNIALNVSATYYAYPGSTSDNAIELTALLEGEHGPLTLSGGGSFAPPQSGTRTDTGVKTTNLYVFASASYAVPGLPMALHVRAGHERGAWDARAKGNKWDCSIGADVEFRAVRMSFDAVASNAASETLVGTLFLKF